MLCSEKFPARLVVRLEAGIAAASGGGLHTRLRVAGAAKKIFLFFSKNVTLFVFLSILYVQAKERTNRAGRIGESGDCSLWMLNLICGL